MAGGINKIELVNMAIVGFIIERDTLRLDRDTALALDVHRVQHLLLHFTLGQAFAGLYQAIGQGRLAMIDMGNNRKIANVFHRCVSHRRVRSAPVVRHVGSGNIHK